MNIAHNTVVIGLDIGTTSAKAVAFTLDGKIAVHTRKFYEIYYPQIGWAEQNPEEIAITTFNVLKECLAISRSKGFKPLAVGISSVWHSLIAVDREGIPLTNAIIWADSRSISQYKKLKLEFDEKIIYQETGCPLHPMYFPAKLTWLKETLSRVFQKADKFVSIKEYILLKWFGKHVVDVSVASGTGLLNIITQKWHDSFLKLLGVSEERLSEIVPSTFVIQGLKKNYAVELGINEDLPFIIGGGDGGLSSLGMGAFKPRTFALMVGGSAAIRGLTYEPILDKNLRSWCYLLTGDIWIPGAAINNAGIVYEWFLKNISIGSGTGYLDNIIETIPPGSDGLLCVPLLNGERSPGWNPEAKGILFGLTAYHTRTHLAKALLEGICFRIKDIYNVMVEVLGEPEEIKIAGGMISSPRFRQMLADVLHKELCIVDSMESSALGAAILGLYALGLKPNLNPEMQCLKVKEKILPNEETSNFYEQHYRLFKEIYSYTNIPKSGG